MAPIAGWSIWTKSGERIRQFTVALVADVEAIARVKADNPDVELYSRHPLDADTIAQLGMAEGDITEWVALDCKEKLKLISGMASAPADDAPMKAAQ
jgi:hypothetical protein